MKPELKAMVAQAAGGSPYYLEKVFLAALHWSGDELWCGPFVIGKVFHLCDVFGWRIGNASDDINYDAKANARDALMSAAQEQIRQWFKEQS